MRRLNCMSEEIKRLKRTGSKTSRTKRQYMHIEINKKERKNERDFIFIINILKYMLLLLLFNETIVMIFLFYCSYCKMSDVTNKLVST